MLATNVDEAARRFGDRPAVVAPDGVLTYSQLSCDSIRFAERLTQSGLRHGDVAALVLPSGCDWLVAAVAVNRIGAAYAGISPVLTPAERASMVKLIKARLIVATPDLVDGLPLRSNVMVIEPGSRGRDHDAMGGCACNIDPSTADAPSSADTPASFSDGDPAVICFTSGTTGTPKAAMYTAAQLRAIESIDLGPAASEIWDGGSPMLASTQFAHVGMSTKLPWYARLGVTLHVMERWRADAALTLVSENRMPVIGAIAPQLALMVRSPLVNELDLSSVNMVIAGGAASPPALVREVRQTFSCGYSIRYSSTESGGVGLATDAMSDDESEWASVGRPRDGVEARIADESDHEVPDGEVGELQIRSGATMHSYWNDPVATAAALTEDRWLRTGDLARIDDHGRVVLVGRHSDMYIRGGYNVFPSEVEATLREHPAVSDIVIIATNDDVMGEIGVALVVPSDDASLDLDDLRRFGSESLAHYKLPERLMFIESVPLSSAQKIDRRAAKDLFESTL